MKRIIQSLTKLGKSTKGPKRSVHSTVKSQLKSKKEDQKKNNQGAETYDSGYGYDSWCGDGDGGDGGGDGGGS